MTLDLMVIGCGAVVEGLNHYFTAVGDVHVEIDGQPAATVMVLDTHNTPTTTGFPEFLDNGVTIVAMSGLPSSENGISPAQVRATRRSSTGTALHLGRLLLFVVSENEHHHHYEGDHYNQDHSVSAEERLRPLSRGVSLVIFLVYHVLTRLRLLILWRTQNNPRSGSCPCH